jgi:hypothetical protein
MSTQQEKNNQTENQTLELTIAEKAAVTYFEEDLTDRIFEPDMLVSMIHTIIGDNKPLNTRTPMNPADELAHLLINLLEVGAFSEMAQTATREAIECCFLHSPVYQLALKLYYLEHEGRLRSAPTAYETIQQAIDSADKGEDIDAHNDENQEHSSMQMPQADPSVKQVIRANRFELIDINGNLCAELFSLASPGKPGAQTIFNLKGANGHNVSIIADSLTGEAGFRIFDDQNNTYPLRLGTGTGGNKVSLKLFGETLLYAKRPQPRQ